MADSDKPKSEGRAESPTTARELDFDDDEPASHPQTPAKDVTHTSTVASKVGGAESSPAPQRQSATTPSQLPRAMSPREQAELTLQEAFPSIDASVVKAVLAASGGQVEPAFNALLGMTDPDSVAQNEQPREQAAAAAPPPAQPPRPKAPPVAKEGQSQLEADELYARQLAEHYQRQDARAMNRHQQEQQGGRHGYREEERERNFIDDDLPEIGENIRKGFLETQKTVNSWFTNLKKKMDGEDEEPPQLPARRGQPAMATRRSHDYEHYDADPEEFSSDFSKLQLRDDTASQSKQARRANPDLFKPTPAVPSDGARRVSFQEGPPEEIGVSTEAAKANKTSKWQPLSAVEPSPVGEHDPFVLGDSDDDESKKKSDKEKKNTKDTTSDDSSRLATATAEAMAGEIGDDSGNKLELRDNTEDKSKK